MKFVIRACSGIGIAVLSLLASVAVPQYAYACGWLGATLYFVLIANRR